MRRTLICLCLLALAAPALAQPSVTPDEPVVRAPAAPAPRPYSPPAPSASAAEIEAAIIAFESPRFPGCADRALTRQSGGLAPPRLVTERQLREGGVTTYRYVYQARGCAAAPRTHNVEVLAHQGLQPMVLVLPPGDNPLTSRVMQGIVSSIFTPMMRARYPACAPRDLKILEANVSAGSPYVRGQTWSETWSYDACGGVGRAEITYAYDGEGLRTTANVMPAS